MSFGGIAIINEIFIIPCHLRQSQHCKGSQFMIWDGRWSYFGRERGLEVVSLDLSSAEQASIITSDTSALLVTNYQLPPLGYVTKTMSFFFLIREKDQWNFMKYICFQVQYCNSKQCHHHNHHHPPVSKQVGLQMARLSIEENKYCLGGKEELNVQHI